MYTAVLTVTGKTHDCSTLLKTNNSQAHSYNNVVSRSSGMLVDSYIVILHYWPLPVAADIELQLTGMHVPSLIPRLLVGRHREPGYEASMSHAVLVSYLLTNIVSVL